MTVPDSEGTEVTRHCVSMFLLFKQFSAGPVTWPHVPKRGGAVDALSPRAGQWRESRATWCPRLLCGHHTWTAEPPCLSFLTSSNNVFFFPPSSHTASPPCSEKLQAAVSPGPLLQLTGAPRTHPCSSSGLIFSIPVGGTFTLLQRESSGGPSLVLAETNCVPLPVSSASHAHV